MLSLSPGHFALVHSVRLHSRRPWRIVVAWCCNRHHKSALTVSSARLTLSGRYCLGAPCGHWWEAYLRRVVSLPGPPTPWSRFQDSISAKASSHLLLGLWRPHHISLRGQALNGELGKPALIDCFSGIEIA